VSPVVAGVGGRGRGYGEESGKQENQDFLHFCSSNCSLMDLGGISILGLRAGATFGPDIPHLSATKLNFCPSSFGLRILSVLFCSTLQDLVAGSVQAMGHPGLMRKQAVPPF
jgi:hypothetical protein